jgi:sterol desaturase/sphingolipid hydroxylase (fatty acid hydroxylase superfamily)
MGPVIRRFVAFAILFVVLGVVEQLFAARKDQKRFRKGFGTDVLHFAFTEGLTQVALVIAIFPLAVLVHFLAPEGPRLWVQSLPGPAQVALGLLVIDFVSYWRHRLMHTVPFLWRIHAVHHSSEHMDWLASVRVHPLDTVLGRAATFVPLFALGFSKGSFGGVVGLLRLLGLFFHCNVH